MKYIQRLISWLFGWYEVDAVGDGACIATMLMKHFPEAYLLRRTDTGVRFRIPMRIMKRLKSAADEWAITLAPDCGHGLIMLVRRYRRRPGIIVGALLFFGVVYLSSAVVWNIDFKETDGVSESEVLMRFEEMGLKLGAFVPPLDLDSMCNRYLMTYDDLSWVSVNMFGNTAKVECRPKYKTPEKPSSAPSSLVASSDGQITYFNVTSGLPVTEVNEAVLKGQTLVSGIMEYKDGRVELVPSRGQVFAEVKREAEVFVPYEYQRRVPSGEVGIYRSLRFFSLNIKLYINKVKSDEKYDRIKEEKRAVLPSGTPLPFSLVSDVFTEYKTETVRLSDEDVKQAAERRLSEAVTALTERSVLLKRSDSGEYTEGGYLARSELLCIEDIATEMPIIR